MKKNPIRFSQKEIEYSSMMAQYIAKNAVRNAAPLEAIHRGFWPATDTGDYSDVRVVTPAGEIPWNSLSRISQAEMKEFNKNVVNAIFTIFLAKYPGAFLGLPARWDAPKPDMGILVSLQMLPNDFKAKCILEAIREVFPECFTKDGKVALPEEKIDD